MTTAATFTALAARFMAADPAPSKRLKRALTTWPAALPEGDFPIAAMREQPQISGELNMETIGDPGLGSQYYFVEAAFLVGLYTAPKLLSEFQERMKPWPRALQRVLVADITLSAGVSYLGHGEGKRIATYQIGEIVWINGSVYFGMKALIPVMETELMTVG